MTTYIAPGQQQLMELNRLDTFDRVWGYEASWFEEPNYRRGGWSGVGRIDLKRPEGGEVGAYLKRQENHRRRAIRHPIVGVPTFLREYAMLKFLSEHGVSVPRLLFFAEHNTNGKHQAILMTQELAGYRSLEEIADELFVCNPNGRPSLAVQNSLLRKAAITIRALHDTRIEHRSLYPKHIFVRLSGQLDAPPEMALIDLEKARFNWFSLYSTYLDLAALNRHSPHWTRTRRLYFYKQYFGITKLTFWTKWMCRVILKRSRRAKR